MDTLIIRADAGPAIGHGHVMRCLALAQARQDRGGRCVFVTSQPAPAIEARLTSEGFAVLKLEAAPGSREDASEVAGSAAQLDAHWAVIDGYHFGPEYQQALKSAAGLKLLVIDDYGQIGAYAADIILDQNAGAREILYAHREPATELLLGTRYAMLRREFKAWGEWKREIPPVARKILVTMGGSDPENLTVRTVEALLSLIEEALDVTAVIGTSSPQQKALEAMAATDPRLRVLMNAPNMPELTAWADMAIIAGGGTLWELLHMGCPALSFSRNAQQYHILTMLRMQRTVEFLGHAQDFDRVQFVSAVTALAASLERRCEMSRAGRTAVDGLGAERICEVIGNGNNIDGQFGAGARLEARL